MKHQDLIIILFLLLGITTTAFAQQNDSTTITMVFPEFGQWENQDVFLEKTHPVFYPLKDTIFLDKMGSKNIWSIKFSILKPEIWRVIIYGSTDFELLVLPNDEIEIFSGYRLGHKLLKGKIMKEYESICDWEGVCFLNSTYLSDLKWTKRTKQEIDSLTNMYLTNYEKAFQNSTPNPIFDSYFRSELRLAQIEALKVSQGYIRSYLNVFSIKISEENKKPIPIYSLDLEKNVPYSEAYIYTGIYPKINEKCKDTKSRVEKIKCQYETIKKLENIDEELRKLLCFSIARGIQASVHLGTVVGVDDKQVKELNELLIILFEDLEAKYPNTKEVAFVKTQISKNEIMSAGQPAPVFSLKDKEGKIISLSDLKGKYVLIDFWKTWSKSCIREISFSKKLEEEFRDDVTFVYICISSDKKTWQKVIAEKSLEGIQFFIEKEIEKQIIKDYQIVSYPYILLDREGKIITKNIIPSINGKEVLKETIEAEK